MSRTPAEKKRCVTTAHEATCKKGELKAPLCHCTKECAVLTTVREMSKYGTRRIHGATLLLHYVE